jgi:hypothetical protein
VEEDEEADEDEPFLTSKSSVNNIRELREDHLHGVETKGVDCFEGTFSDGRLINECESSRGLRRNKHVEKKEIKKNVFSKPIDDII